MKYFKKVFVFMVSLLVIISALVIPMEAKAEQSAEGLFNTLILNDDTFSYFGNAGEQGGWGTDKGVEALYNGDSHWSNLSSVPVQNSVYYEFTFTGTSVALYGNMEKNFGKVKVSIDGIEKGIFDGYHADKQHQQKLWESDELSNQEHTLRATLTNEKNALSGGYNTLIDYASVSVPVKTQNAYTLEVGQTFKLPLDKDLTKVSWTSTAENIASVDNGIITAKAEGTTKVILKDLETEDSTAFDIMVIKKLMDDRTEDSYYKETIVNDTETGTGELQFDYHGEWGMDANIDGLYDKDAHWCDESYWIDSSPRNHFYTVKFTGRKVAIYGSLQPRLGIYEVYIDDVYMGKIDAYAAKDTKQQLYFESSILEEKEHVLKVVMTGEKNSLSQYASGFVDFIEVTQNVRKIYPEKISLKNNAAIWEENTAFKPEIDYEPATTNQKEISWEVDNDMIRVNDDGSLTPLASGKTSIVAVAKGKDGVKVKSAPLEITIQEGNYLGKADFVSKERTILPEQYDEFSKNQNKENTMTLWQDDSANAAAVLLSKEIAVDAEISVSNFVNEYGDELDASHIEANFQKYISTYTGSNWIPSPRPFDPPKAPTGNRKDYADVIYGSKMHIEKESVQPIWITVNVPKDTKPGIYEGKISITLADGEIVELIQKVEVLELVLETDDYYLNLWQYPYASAQYYDVKPFSDEHLAIVKNQMEPYMQASGKTGTASIVEEPWYHQTYCDYPSMVKWIKNNGEWSFDYTDFDRWVDFLINDVGVSYVECYSIVPWENILRYTEDSIAKEQKAAPGSKNWEDAWKPFLQSFTQHLDEKGWYDNIIIAMDERPMDQMNAALNLIESIENKDGKTFKVGGAVGSYNKEVWDRLFTVTPHIANISESNIPLNTIRRVADKRREEGKLTSIYTMIGDYPGMFSMSDPGEAAWTIWFAEYCNTDGFLRWAYDAWVKDPLNDNAHPYFEAGDMYFVYPGDYAGKDTKVRTSPRFELMAEAINDVKKLRQIANQGLEAKERVDALMDSVQSFYGQGYGNGIGTAGFRTGSEETKSKLADEVKRLHNETVKLARDYELSIVKEADYSAVDKVVAEVKNLNRGKYTQVSLAMVDKAIDAVIYGYTTAHQDKVDAMAKAIEAAMADLEEISYATKEHLAVLETLLSKMEAYELSKYTEESQKDITAAMEALKVVITQYKDQKLTEAAANLVIQQASHVKPIEKTELINKTALSELIGNAENAISKQDEYHKDDNWARFIKVLAEAKIVMEDTTADQAKVNEIVTMLGKAYEDIRLLPDEKLLAQLEDFIDDVNTIQRANYTSADLIQIDKAKAKAQAMLDAKYFTEEEFITFTPTMAKIKNIIINGQIQSSANNKDLDKQNEKDFEVEVPNTADVSDLTELFFLLITGGTIMLAYKRRHTN